MKNLVPDFATKDALFSFLRTNKSKLVAQKKALPLFSDNLEFGYSKSEPVKVNHVTKVKAKADTTEDVDLELQVDIISNVSGWCDSQMDVMIKDSWKKSISDLGASGQKLIYHLKNHNYTTDDIIGKNPTLYVKDLDLSMFNFKSDIKRAQALMMSSIVCEDYDCKTYNLYQDQQIKQHSIGLQYVQIKLCMNSKNEEDAVEKGNWDIFYPGVVNKSEVDEASFFWAVTECKIFEVSAVLFGSNILTPVFSTSQPSTDTDDQPPKSTDEKIEIKGAKSMLLCPSCDKFFYASAEGGTSCTNCGQFVSRQSNSLMLPTFDLINAINETTFITN